MTGRFPVRAEMKQQLEPLKSSDSPLKVIVLKGRREAMRRRRRFSRPPSDPGQQKFPPQAAKLVSFYFSDGFYFNYDREDFPPTKASGELWPQELRTEGPKVPAGAFQRFRNKTFSVSLSFLNPTWLLETLILHFSVDGFNVYVSKRHCTFLIPEEAVKEIPLTEQ